MNTLYAETCVSISELKKNPAAILREADGESVVILSHNKPQAYLVPVAIYENMLERLDDMALAKIIKERENEKSVRVNLDEI